MAWWQWSNQYAYRWLHTKPNNLLEQEIINLTNEERAKAGLLPLAFSEDISEVARLKAKDMGILQYFAHESPQYGSPFEMMERCGIRFVCAGENLGKGFASPEGVIEGWMASPTHRENILNDRYREIGAGYFLGPDHIPYWVQHFIAR